MIFGLPGSGEKSLMETFSFLEENSTNIDTLTTSEFLLYNDTPFGKSPERYGLIKDKPLLFCRIGGKDIHTIQSSHRIMENGYPRMPRGPEESDRWLKRKPWIYPPSIFDSLPSEHYLILSSLPEESHTPIRPVPLREIS